MDAEMCNASTQAAEALIAVAGIHSVPVDVKALAYAQGIVSVKAAQLGSSSAQLVGLRRFHIQYSAAEGLRRQRFSICHEIGHSFFVSPEQHKAGGLRVRAQLESSLEPETEERLCDLVAGVLLMPRKHFSDAAAVSIPSLNGLERLAEIFQVHPIAVLKRMQSLRIEWPCAVLRWTPVADCGRVVGFRLNQNWAIDQRAKPAMAVGSVVAFDGFFKTVRSLKPAERCGSLSVVSHNGFRIEGRARNIGGRTEVWSLALVDTAS